MRKQKRRQVRLMNRYVRIVILRSDGLVVSREHRWIKTHRVGTVSTVTCGTIPAGAGLYDSFGVVMESAA